MTETIIGKEGISKEELRGVITEGITDAIIQLLSALCFALIILFTVAYFLLPTK